METGKVALGILGGLAAGVLLGILFAPHKGSKTRKKMLAKGKDYVDGLTEKLEEVYQDTAGKYENLIGGTKKEL